MHIRKGEIYGFLGPNGAGKTTIMKMLTSLVKPTSGEINILGHKLTNRSGFVASLPAICGFLGGLLGGFVSDFLLKKGCSITVARKTPIILGMLMSWADVAKFTFAFASCQQYEHGYYTAYQHMAKEKLDLVFHLGDYIWNRSVLCEGNCRGAWREHSIPE